MKEIQTFTEFQLTRLKQLDEGIKNVNHFERMMDTYKTGILFIGGSEDGEVSVDRETIKIMKGGISGIYRELRSEGLGEEAEFVIYQNKFA